MARRQHSAPSFAFRSSLCAPPILAALLACAALTLHAQTVVVANAARDGGAAAVASPPSPKGLPCTTALGAASLSGSISDGVGALVPGARVLLRTNDGAVERTVSSDAEGRFTFVDLAPGTYALAVSAPGFDTSAVPRILLRQGEARNLPGLSLAIPLNHADVVVTVARKDLATDEIHAQERQRVFGFPDFYTSYLPNAAPLSSGQKFGLALRATTDTMSFAGAALIAAGEQAQNTFPTYRQGLRGYAKRYGAAYTDGFVGKMIGSAFLPSVFRQDPRYFYDGSSSYRHRALHAVLSAVLARGDNGKIEPNYSHILGNAAAGAISTLYHPATDSAGKLALDNALLGTLGEAGVNLTREFVLRHFTRGLAPLPMSP